MRTKTFQSKEAEMKKVIATLILCFIVSAMGLLVITHSSWASQGKPIQLLYGTFDPPKNHFSQVWGNYAKELEERTGGRVQVRFNWAMDRPGAFLDLTQKGIIDFGWAIPTLHPGMFPLTGVVELPWVIPTCEISSKAINAYFEKGYLDKGYKDVKVLWFGAMNSDYTLLGEKSVKRVEDFKGLKISAGGPIAGKRVKLMGGVPTFIPFPEQYGAIRKGIIDGTVMGFPMMEVFRLFEVSKNALAPPMGTGVYAITMNKKKWDSLPADIQGIMDDMSKKYMIEFARAWDAACLRGEKLFLDAGGQIHALNKEELEKVSNSIRPIWADWITATEKAGLPGKKAVSTMYTILQDLGISNPAVGYTPGD
jgi:TRAP-type C4-dicarboxylate transport system substrate-binding protein